MNHNQSLFLPPPLDLITLYQSESYVEECRTAPVRSRIKLPKISNVEKGSPTRQEPERSLKGMMSTEKPFQTSLELEKEMTSYKGANSLSKGGGDLMKDTSEKKM